MKKMLALIAPVVSLIAGSAYAGGILDPNLQKAMTSAGPNGQVSALIYLSDNVNITALDNYLETAQVSLPTRHETVVRALQDKANTTQGPILAAINQMKQAGTVTSFQPYWISNIIRVDGTPAAVRQLADRDDVKIVYLNYPIELINPVKTQRDTGQHPENDPEPGIVAIRANEVWDTFGLTGEGVLVSTLDTGVDGHHPCLQSRWRGLDSRYSGHPEWAWFDNETHTTFPTAFGDHGTHTMGTVCGGAPGDSVGVAPGAEWISAGVIDRIDIAHTVADSILAFQWIVDPDGNPSTDWDVPASCSNSWGLVTAHGYPPCDQTFWSYLDAVEAGGTVVIFSAGNEGFSGLRRPADRATDPYRTFSVAAVDANTQGWPIASFSSRGPTFCTPDQSPAIKPDISAPGVHVRSSIPGNQYAYYDGTSMASPHINGVCALVREANPDISVQDIKQIIFDTAHDLGDPGEDNNYGYGMIDAFEAVAAASSGQIPMHVSTSGLAAGVFATFDVSRATPGARVAFFYSLAGRGSTVINQLNVTLDIAGAIFNTTRQADGNGECTLNKRIQSGTTGREVWIQVAENGNKSNVLDEVIR